MPCSQPGPSVSGRKIPDSSSSGTTTVLISGANASSLLTSRPVAYDTDARPTATSTMNPKPMNTAATGARQPLQQRAEQRQVQDRLHQADDDPGRLAQRQPLLAAEDQQRVADEGHAVLLGPSVEMASVEMVSVEMVSRGVVAQRAPGQ